MNPIYPTPPILSDLKCEDFTTLRKRLYTFRNLSHRNTTAEVAKKFKISKVYIHKLCDWRVSMEGNRLQKELAINLIYAFFEKVEEFYQR